MLSAWRSLVVPLANSVPLKRLPPSRGITLSTTPLLVYSADVLPVGQWRRPRNRHAFFDGADAQLSAHRRVEAWRQFEPFAPERREPGQRKCHGVGARYQFDDAVLAALVGDGAPNLFDQHRTGRFDRDAGQNGARRVGHYAGDASGARALREH